MDLLPPPPPSQDYLSSIGKDDDGNTPEEPDQPTINLFSQILLIIFSVVCVYVWGRFAAGFHDFLDPSTLCAGEGLVSMLSCEDGVPRKDDWFTQLWDTLKDTSGAGPKKTVDLKTFAFVPLLYGVGTFASPLIAALEGAKIGWQWTLKQWWGELFIPFSYFAAFWIAFAAMCVGFWGVSIEIPLRAAMHIYSCSDCGLDALSPITVTAMYLVAMFSVWGSVCLATAGHTIIKIILGTIFLLSGFAIYSTANSAALKTSKPV